MYMSPEVADRKPYGAPSDTYGLGCVLLEMMVRQQVCARHQQHAPITHVPPAVPNIASRACSDARALCISQLRERRPFETRKDYIREALDEARSHGWHTFSELSELAWRMLEENPKTRVALPTAAASAAAASSILMKQLAAADARMISSVKNGAPLEQPRAVDSSPGRTRPPKRVAKDERLVRASAQERRRRLLYAD